MTEPQTHYRALYDKLYLGAWELPKDRDITVTIESVKGAELVVEGGAKNKKPVIGFVGKEKKFVSNITNSRTIAGMYGDFVQGWVGKRISLFVAQTRDPKNPGQQCDCIRVRPTAPAAKQSQAAQTEDV